MPSSVTALLALSRSSSMTLVRSAEITSCSLRELISRPSAWRTIGASRCAASCSSPEDAV